LGEALVGALELLAQQRAVERGARGIGERRRELPRGGEGLEARQLARCDAGQRAPESLLERQRGRALEARPPGVVAQEHERRVAAREQLGEAREAAAAGARGAQLPAQRAG